MTQLEINQRMIGNGNPVYIIAEMSANHGGDLSRAVEIIRAAKNAGADAIKLQTYTADTITLKCNNEYFQIQQGTIWDGRVLHELYEEAHTPWEWHPELKKVADEVGLDFFSSPFDETAVDFLETLEVPAYKVASFEINDIGLLKKIGATGKPVIFSTGMASGREIELAIKTLRDAGTDQVAMLKCTSAYPAEPADMNLATIVDMNERYQIPVGLSDHSMGIEVPVVSVALGATIIEKHLTLDRKYETADSSFSLEPYEFAEMVKAVRRATAAVGEVTYGACSADQNNRRFRRSLFVVNDVQPGEKLTKENVRSIRPGDGLEPIHLQAVLGRVVSEPIERGTPLQWRHIA